MTALLGKDILKATREKLIICFNVPEPELKLRTQITYYLQSGMHFLLLSVALKAFTNISEQPGYSDFILYFITEDEEMFRLQIPTTSEHAGISSALQETLKHCSHLHFLTQSLLQILFGHSCTTWTGPQQKDSQSLFWFFNNEVIRPCSRI